MVGCVGGVGEGRVGEEGGEERGILGVGEGVRKSFPVWVARPGFAAPGPSWLQLGQLLLLLLLLVFSRM